MKLFEQKYQIRPILQSSDYTLSYKDEPTCCFNAPILLFQFVSITRDLLDPAPPVALGVGWKNIWQPADPGLRLPSGTPGSRLFVEFLFVVWFADPVTSVEFVFGRICMGHRLLLMVVMSSQ